MADFPGTTYPGLGIDAEGTNDFGSNPFPGQGIYAELDMTASMTMAGLGVAADVTEHLGTLMPGPDVSARYLMRAFKTSVPTGHLYWESWDVADPTGLESGFNPLELTDIVVVAVFCD